MRTSVSAKEQQAQVRPVGVGGPDHGRGDMQPDSPEPSLFWSAILEDDEEAEFRGVAIVTQSAPERGDSKAICWVLIRRSPDHLAGHFRKESVLVLVSMSPSGTRACYPRTEPLAWTLTSVVSVQRIAPR